MKSSETLKVISPIDGSVYAERQLASARQIQQTLEQARQAQSTWQQLTISQRATYCTKAIDAFIRQKDIIAEEICWQMGRPIRYCAGEISGFEERARHMVAIAEDALAPVNIPEKPDFQRWITREALGTVFVIAPWNYPYLTAVNSIIPALMAGNTVILKHSAQTPLCAERLAEAFAAAGLPTGVFQYLHLSHHATEQLMQTRDINHRDIHHRDINFLNINYVAFTGSVAGGNMVEKAIAGRFIGSGLELGGKDPAYIRGDADIQQAVETVVDGAFFNAGQSCCGIERVYIHTDIHDEVVNRIVSLVKEYQLGRPDHPDTTLGPVVRPAAAEFVREQIADAVKQGAKSHISPEDFPAYPTSSAYLPPQVLTDVNHSMRVMTEESFGPVLGIQKVSSDNEAIAFMNDSQYGLTAAVFTQDIEQGIAMGNQLETGTFFINRCDYLDPALAWTGVKNSGRGCTLSQLGYATLTRPKSFHIKMV